MLPTSANLRSPARTLIACHAWRSWRRSWRRRLPGTKQRRTHSVYARQGDKSTVAQALQYRITRDAGSANRSLGGVELPICCCGPAQTWWTPPLPPASRSAVQKRLRRSLLSATPRHLRQPGTFGRSVPMIRYPNRRFAAVGASGGQRSKTVRLSVLFAARSVRP